MSDRGLARALVAVFAFVASGMLLGWGWRVPGWQDLPSVRLDLALNGSEAALAVRAEATEPTDVTNQVRIFHDANELRLLGAYPLSDTLADAFAADGLPVVPGLANTLSWDALSEASCVSRHMVPQGIAVSPRWLFVSAYDGAHAANSVVYLVDRATGVLAKTVVLAGQPHVGGLAYDDDHGRLWVCSRRGQVAQLVSLDVATLEAAEEGAVEPVSYESTALLRGPKRASCVEYFDGSLYVGFFNATGNGRLYRYLLDDDGLLEPGVLNVAAENWELPPCAQGVALTDGHVLVSLSHGKRSSELMVYERDVVFDHVASLPVHGGRPIYGSAEAWLPGGEGSAGSGAGSAAGSLAAGGGSDGGAAGGGAAGGGPDGGLPLPGLPDLDELIPLLFGMGGESEGAGPAGEESEGTGPAGERPEGSGSAAGTQVAHAPFAEGLALMAADRSAIQGTMAYGMTTQAADLAASGERAEREVVSYAVEPLLTAELPPMMEDLTVRDGQLFTVHESGATVYRNRYGVGVDRVVSYPLSLLDVALSQGVRLLSFDVLEQGDAGGSAAGEGSAADGLPEGGATTGGGA